MNVRTITQWLAQRRILLLALAPAVITGVFLVCTAHYGFLDDGVTVLMSRGSQAHAFKVGGAGRFMPAYWLYFWGLFKVFPEHPATLAAGNAVTLLLIAGLAYRFTRRLSGAPWAAVGAAWLVTLNSATAEASFTLSKVETEQLIAWLIALMLLIPGETRLARLWMRIALMVICAGLCGLYKETGVLLLVPLAVGAVAWWRGVIAERRAEYLGMLLAGALPLLAIGGVIALRSVGAGSYAREHVMQGQAAPHLSPALLISKDWALSALFACGLLAGPFLILRREAHARLAAGLAWSQLVVLVAFFCTLRAMHLYYLVVPAALAACLSFAAVSLIDATALRRVFLVLFAGLSLWTVDHGITAGSALTGWSWLYGRLTEAVRTGRPSRVLFYRAGGTEVHSEARQMWTQVHPVGTEVGLLGGPDDGSGLPVVPFRALRTGDWIIEQFGPEINRANPIRDLGVAWPEDYALAPGRVKVVRYAQYRARYPAYGRGMTLLSSHRKGAITWRISVVDEPPQVDLEGVGIDNWLEPVAALWIAERRVDPVILNLLPFAPPGPGFENRLEFVGHDGRVVTSCRITTPAPCAIAPAQLSDVPRHEGWMRLGMRAERSFSPLELGLSPDPRKLSFNITLPPSDSPAR